MMKRAIYQAVLVGLIGAGVASAAHATAHRGTPITTGQAPTLQNVTVPMGVLTQTGRGGVLLDGLDFTTLAIKPQTFAGFDLMTPNSIPCNTYTLAFLSNSAGRPGTDFTIPGANAPHATALSPIVSSTGVNHLAGDYIWTAKCTSAGGVDSNTVQIKYQSDLASAYIGSADRLDFGVYPGSMGSVAGQSIKFAVGFDNRTIGTTLSVASFTNQVNILPADSLRRPALASFRLSGSAPGNVKISDMVLSGTIPSGVTSSFIINYVTTPVHDILVDNVHYYGSEAMLQAFNGSLTSQGAIGFTGCSANCTIQNSSFDYIESGASLTSNVTYNDVFYRYFYNNCLVIGQGAANIKVTGGGCFSPMQRPGGVHPDNLQGADASGNGPSIVFQRFTVSQADGSYFAQGPYFGGGGVDSRIFIDDGSGNGVPSGIAGNVATRVGAGWGSSTNGKIAAVQGLFTSAAGITVTCLGSNGCPAASQVTLVGLTPTQFGTFAAPVKMTTADGTTVYVFIDNGAGGGRPSGVNGNVATKVSGGWGYALQGSLVAVAGLFDGSAGIHVRCSPQSCDTATQATLVGLSPTIYTNDVNPGQLVTLGMSGMQMSGIVSIQAGPYGLLQVGNSGTSWLYDYDYVAMKPQNPLTGTFQGQLVNGLLTATTQATSNLPNEQAFIEAGGRLRYTGSNGLCDYCFNGGVGFKTSGSALGPGTYNTQTTTENAPLQTMTITGGYSTGAPFFSQAHCNDPLIQEGTFNIDRGVFWSGMFPQTGTGCVVGTNFPAPNTTIGNHAFGPTSNGYTPPGGALTAADYASGMLPFDYIAAHTFTAAETYQDNILVACLANKGKIGGKKDGGGGVWYGAFTGETNALTHTGGGDWIYFDGTNHVVGPHIPGCENAP